MDSAWLHAFRLSVTLESSGPMVFCAMVAINGGGCPTVRQCMSSLQPEQDPASSSSWPFAPLTCSSLTMVPHFRPIYYWSSPTQTHCRPHNSRPVQQYGTLPPFLKLPSAKPVLQHVLRIHGLLTDILCGLGSQITSIFWKESCTLLGSSISLSSGFHLQFNGQIERPRSWKLPFAV